VPVARHKYAVAREIYYRNLAQNKATSSPSVDFILPEHMVFFFYSDCNMFEDIVKP